MDPNTNLKELLSLARADWGVSQWDSLSKSDVDKMHAEHLRIQELVLALDQWLANGGFVPDRWNVSLGGARRSQQR